MALTSKLKSVDFYRKIPRDLTEASLSGAGLSIIAALCMVFLFGMELNNYLDVRFSSSIVVDNSSDGDFLRLDFNMSFPALSCEFASVDVIDVLGTNRLNISKTVRKYSIDSNLRAIGSEFQSGSVANVVKHDEEVEEEYAEGSITLNARNFDRVAHEFPILVVNFYAPWCYWSNRLKPSWEKAANILKERYDPGMDGRILLAKVDCTVEVDLCKRNHVQGYPSIRIFRKGINLREDHGQHEHESYYGDRDTDSLVQAMEELVAPISLESQGDASDNKTLTDTKKRPAPTSGGCRLEGFVRIKKVPGSLVISARSRSHSFDAAKMNMSHVISHFSFGKLITAREWRDVKKLLPRIGLHYDRLRDTTYITNPKDSIENVTIEHYIQVVKTEVVTRSYRLVEDYEYTAHSSLIHNHHLPIAKFHIVPSPMQVLLRETPKSFSHFLTNVCAIIGGVFTVAGILDSVLHSTMTMVRKIELGKNH